MADLSGLRLLNEDVLPPEVSLSIRALRKRARDLGQCYVISRKVLVSEDQLAAIVESFRVPAKPGMSQAEIDAHVNWWMNKQKRRK